MYGHESLVMTETVRPQIQASEIRIFRKSKEFRCLTMFVTLQIKNFSSSSRYFSESKDLSLDGLAV